VVDDLACDGVFVHHVRDLPDARFCSLCLIAKILAVLEVATAVVINAYGAPPLLLVRSHLGGQARGIARGVERIIVWAGKGNTKGQLIARSSLTRYPALTRVDLVETWWLAVGKQRQRKQQRKRQCDEQPSPRHWSGTQVFCGKLTGKITRA
jgi:hypothetical protein